METEGLLTWPQEPATEITVLSLTNQVHMFQFCISPPIYTIVFQMISMLQILRLILNSIMNSPCMINGLRILSFFIYSA
jgi:hypothetical protein